MRRSQPRTKKQPPLKLFAPPESPGGTIEASDGVPNKSVLSNENLIHYEFLGTDSSDADLDVQGQRPLDTIILSETRTYSRVLFVNRRLQFISKDVPDWLPLPIGATIGDGSKEASEQAPAGRYDLLTLELWHDIHAATDRLDLAFAAGQLDPATYQRAGRRFLQLHDAVTQLGQGDFSRGLACLPHDLS